MVPLLDVVRTQKESGPENLRMQIVEMAVKNSSDFDERGQGHSGRSQAGRDSRVPLSKRSDATLGFNDDDKKRSGVYPIVQKKKDCINLNFTSMKNDPREGNKSTRHLKAEHTFTRDKPSRPGFSHLKNRIATASGTRKNDTREESKIPGEQSTENTTPLLPQKVSLFRPKTTSYKQTTNLSSVSHLPKADVHQNDGKADSPHRTQNHIKSQRQSQREALVKCEIKGNAVPASPYHQAHLMSSRRAGLFSASLAAFKRRLRVSSKKFTARLHDDSSTKEEEYIITVDEANMRAREQNTPKTLLLPLDNHPFHSGHVNVLTHTANYTLDGNKTPRIEITNNVARRVDFDQESSSNSSQSSQADKAPIKSNYRLQDASQQESLDPKPPNTLPSVTSAKTYVLDTDEPLMVNQKRSEPIPLTVHNLRLHESILSMHARRARRLERCRRMMNDGEPMETSRTWDYTKPSDVIQKWLEGVDTQETRKTPRLEPTKRFDMQVIQPCSAENVLDIQQAHKTVIFV